MAGTMTLDTPEALRGHAAMLLFAAAISWSFTLGAMAAPYIAPEAMTALRFAVAGVVMGLLAAPVLRIDHLRALWRYPVLGGLLGIYFILMFEALRITDPISTGAVFTLTPIMSAVFGYLLMRQITTRVMALSLGLAGLGALWVIFRADVEAMIGLRFGQGETLFLIGCASHAIYTPLSRMLHRGEPLIVYSFLGLCGGAVVTGLYGLPELLATEWRGVPVLAWWVAAYLAVVTTALTFLLLQYATQRLPSAKVMAYGYLVPVFVILWEGLLGHGWIAQAVWLGVVAVLAGLAILLRR